jgi:hypothetical protein
MIREALAALAAGRPADPAVLALLPHRALRRIERRGLYDLPKAAATGAAAR